MDNDGKFSKSLLFVRLLLSLFLKSGTRLESSSSSLCQSLSVMRSVVESTTTLRFSMELTAGALLPKPSRSCADTLLPPCNLSLASNLCAMPLAPSLLENNKKKTKMDNYLLLFKYK